MRKLFLIFSLFFTFTFNFNLNCQDYHLSQILDACSFLNPANVGLNQPLYTSLTYRQQWLNISSPYKTAILDVNGRIFTQSGTGSSLGLGLIVIHDNSGINAKLNTLNAQIALMGKVLLSENQNLSAGIIGGVMQRKINGDIKWSGQYNPITLEYDETIPGEELKKESKINPDIGAGIQWSYGRGASTISSQDQLGAQIGISFYHLNKPDISFLNKDDNRYIRGLIHGSLIMGIINTPLQINPGLIYQFQGPSKMLLFGSKIKYLLQEASKYTGFLFSRTLNFGAYYRLNEALILLLQIEWDRFAFGISYDATISHLTTKAGSQGTIEVNLKYLPGKEYTSSKLL